MAGDFADNASDTTDFLKDIALQQRAPEGPRPRGYCLNCAELFTDTSRRFCNSDCRDDWERLKK